MNIHSGYLGGFSGLLRRIADRIDHQNAPRITNWSFTFEDGEGIRFREDGKGCPVAYFAEDYERAHTEADSAQVSPEEAAIRAEVERMLKGRGKS